MNARISVHYTEGCGPYRQEAAQFLQVASRYELWWSERAPDQTALLPSFVRLSDEFFEEVTNRPVPLDMQALRLLKGSPMRLDLYVWLTYRMSYLRRPTPVTWDQLRLQFGTQAQNRAARYAFKNHFLGHLTRVLAVYPAAQVEETETGRLSPSRPHVSRNGRRSLNQPDAGDQPTQ